MGLAKLAKDAAAIENASAGEALGVKRSSNAPVSRSEPGTFSPFGKR